MSLNSKTRWKKNQISFWLVKMYKGIMKTTNKLKTKKLTLLYQRLISIKKRLGRSLRTKQIKKLIMKMRTVKTCLKMIMAKLRWRCSIYSVEIYSEYQPNRFKLLNRAKWTKVVSTRATISMLVIIMIWPILIIVLNKKVKLTTLTWSI